MTPVHSLQGLLEQLGPRLDLRWLTTAPVGLVPLLGPRPAATASTRARTEAGQVDDAGDDAGDDATGAAGRASPRPPASHAAQTLVGSLNCIHPNRLQVLGTAEIAHLADLGPAAWQDTVERLFAARPAAVIFADGTVPDSTFLTLAERHGVVLLGTPVRDEEVVDRLQYFLTHAMAEREVVHGVFLAVLGMGVLLIGDAGIGKSELALEMIVRGHRLIADDAPEFARIAPEILEGTCPTLLRDFLEVRGLGVLNIRAMFGETAVQQRETLNLVINMRSFDNDALARIDRLRGSLSAHTVLGVAVPEITLPVAPGRNLAILVETAVRNQVLRVRGYDAGVDLMDRQARAIAADAAGQAAP